MNHDDADFLYWKDVKPEFINLVVDTLLDLLEDPAMSGKKPDGTVMNLTELAGYNQMIAMYNNGLKAFANNLIRELEGKAGEDGDG